MATQPNKGNAAPKAAQPTTAPAVVVYKAGKAPRIAGHTATKNGNGGTAGTWALIAAHMAANNGTITAPALQAICTGNGDAGFAGYATRKQKWLVPTA